MFEPKCLQTMTMTMMIRMTMMLMMMRTRRWPGGLVEDVPDTRAATARADPRFHCIRRRRTVPDGSSRGQKGFLGARNIDFGIAGVWGRKNIFQRMKMMEDDEDEDDVVYANIQVGKNSASL